MAICEKKDAVGDAGITKYRFGLTIGPGAVALHLLLSASSVSLALFTFLLRAADGLSRPVAWQSAPE